MEEARKSLLAVVDDKYFYTYGKRWEHAPMPDLATLAGQAQKSGLKNVWVLPGSQLSRMAHEPFDMSEEALQKGGSDWKITGIGEDVWSYISARKHSQAYDEQVEIGLTEFSRWPWEGDNSPKTLLATLITLEDVLGFPVAWTPAWCSLQYVRKMNAGRWDWLVPMTLDLEEKGFQYKDVAMELHWPPKGVEMALPEGATHYVYLDGNSAYAAGMTGLNCGEGNPEWTERPERIYNGKIPGIWKVRYGGLPGQCIWDGRKLPSFSEENSEQYRPWLTTDLVEQFRRSNIPVHLQAGWHWGAPEDKKKRYHQLLRSTAESLWDRRVAMRTLAEETKSQVYVNVHESTRVVIKAIHGKLASPNNAPQFRRKDLWMKSVCRSVAMTAYKVEKIYREFGILPDGIKADELRYPVSDPEMLSRIIDRDKLGGLKHVKTVEIERKG